MRNHKDIDPSRRLFLKSASAAGAMTLVGSTVGLPFGMKPLQAMAFTGPMAEAMANNRAIAVIYLSGAWDNLGSFAPTNDNALHGRRPGSSLGGALPAFNLDGTWGMHQSLANHLGSFWNQQRVALVQGVGQSAATNPSTNRSHFHMQPHMHASGDVGGWFARAAERGFQQSLGYHTLNTQVSMFPRTHPMLANTASGGFSGMVVPSINGSQAASDSLSDVLFAIQSMYDNEAPKWENPVDAIEAQADVIDGVAPGDLAAGGYPSNPLGRAAADAVQLMKNTDVRFVAIDYNGWDVHDNWLVRMDGLHFNLGSTIKAMQNEMAAAGKDLTIVCMSEFGRKNRSKPESDEGTDHGRGTGMMIVGNSVVGAGGGVVHTEFGGWAGLAQHSENYNNATTEWQRIGIDYRTVLHELLHKVVGIDMSTDGTDGNTTVFRNFAATGSNSYLNLFHEPGDVTGDGVMDEADVNRILDRNVNPNAAPEVSVYPADFLDHNNDASLAEASIIAQELGY